ncbi:MAG: tRNA (cytosine(32)/uridine(32)-2'-O)-methyltransferase TrmJ, partial [Rhodocyclaceae bacterium]|nr:tRNA (cytosine(32)/uridine(32)-2'-O)-methyltransferase TrmJ [Rhodocyclaceae bacterium]
WATAEEVEGLHAHLLAAMTQCGFFAPTHPRQLPARLRRLFGRVRLEREEINILRGLLTAMGHRWKK